MWKIECSERIKPWQGCRATRHKLVKKIKIRISSQRSKIVAWDMWCHHSERPCESSSYMSFELDVSSRCMQAYSWYGTDKEKYFSLVLISLKFSSKPPKHIQWLTFPEQSRTIISKCRKLFTCAVFLLDYNNWRQK